MILTQPSAEHIACCSSIPDQVDEQAKHQLCCVHDCAEMHFIFARAALSTLYLLLLGEDRGLLSLYSERFEEFQKTLTKSNEVFSNFKQEMDKMTKKMKKLEKDTATWKSRFENCNKALLDMIEEKAMRAKEYECFVVKIQRLENLCRALQDERNVLYKKIKDAQFPDEKREEEEEEEEDSEETQQKDSLENEAGKNSSVEDPAADELSASNENILKDLAAAFMVTHHVEMPMVTSNEDTAEELHGLQAGGVVCPSEPTLPSPVPQDTANSSVQPTASVPKAEGSEEPSAKQHVQEHPILKLSDADMEGVD
ncbi:Beta-taxilin [Varanus komodoensis]|nr:Beta-taxilin [Varanus komodoensis]